MSRDMSLFGEEGRGSFDCVYVCDRRVHKNTICLPPSWAHYNNYFYVLLENSKGLQTVKGLKRLKEPIDNELGKERH